jgi:stage II sporulation protein AA (anti-sigma F factor antagonist)
MNVELEKQSDIFIVKIKGEIDHHSAEIIKQSVDNGIIFNRCRNIVFDFCGVNFMDSSGIGMIIGRYKKVNAINGIVAASGLNDELLRLFNIAGIHKIIRICDSINDAVRYIEEVHKNEKNF